MTLLVMVKKNRGGGRKGLEEEEDGFVSVLNLKVFGKVWDCVSRGVE